MSNIIEYKPALYDTPADQQVSFTLDIGVIPRGIPHAGKFVVTIQALPLPDRKSADVVAEALVAVINDRLGVKMSK